jgi:NAD(P)-dependent dehydrogenase (short-subunit alcohol dehydrogenase family)
MGRLQDRIAIVTGSNSGIGRAVAFAYGREGAVVICANRSAESKDEDEAMEGATHDLIVQNGGRAEFIQTTITDEASVQALVKAIVDKHGRIDILVNNAGTSQEPKPFWETDDDTISSIIDLNIVATLRMMRAVSKIMIKQDPITAKGERGWIINTGSVFGPRAAAGFLSYGASKSAVIAIGKTAALELAPYGVHVHTINPGTVKTKLTKDVTGPAEAYLKSKALLGFGSPDDSAGPYVFLASDDARWMTGNEIYVDSGYVIT